MIRNVCELAVILAMLLVLVAPGISAADQADPSQRIYATAEGASWARSGMLPYGDFISRIVDADVVFLGEQHDDPATHVLQLAILAALAEARGGGVVLSMEQFERDVQETVDAYLDGGIDEEQFLADSRPWPNYDRDYKPLVEYCHEHGLPVVAANIPRPLASRVAKDGFDAAWQSYTDEERACVAQETAHPKDTYWELFKLAMGIGGDSSHGMGLSEEQAFGYYTSQCMKDDTMAESIASALAQHPSSAVVHTNGSFHSDYGLGTVARVASRNPGARIVTVAIRPATSWSQAAKTTEILPAEVCEQSCADDPGACQLADYIVFVPGPELFSDEAVPPTLVDEPGPAMGMPQ